MSSYVPPKKGTDASPQIGAASIGGRRGGENPGSAEGDTVLARNSGTIQAFIAAQRNAVASSVTNIHRATLDHPEVEATYQNHYGSETITLSPKPTDTSSPPTPEPPGPPNDLPKLAREEVVTSQTPLYLMVLYGIDEIAAIPMDALFSPTVTYAAALSDKTEWVSSPGRILRTLQLSLEGVEHLLLPVDLTGSIKNSKFMLSTNALGDAIQTPGDPDLVPLLNYGTETVWTMAGSFVKVKGKLVLDRSMPADTTGEFGGGTSLTPIAIDVDGTCYYPGGITGNCPVRYSQASLPTDYGSDIVSRALGVAQTNAQKNADSVTIHSPGIVSESYSEIVHTQTANSDVDYEDKSTYTYKVTVITYGQKVTAPVVAYSFIVKGSFGDIPTVSGYKEARTDQDFTDYTPSSNNYGVAHISGTVVVSNDIVIQNYRLGDHVGVTMATTNAIENSTETLTLDPTQPTANAAAATVGSSGSKRTPSGDTDYTLESWTVFGYDPSNTVKSIVINSQSDADNQYSRLITAASTYQGSNGQGGATGQMELSAIPLTVDTGARDDQPFGTASGQYETTGHEAYQFPKGQNPNDVDSAGYAYSRDGDFQQKSVFSDKHTPQIGIFKDKIATLASTQFFKESLTYSDADPTSAATSSYILVHSFPPMLNDNLPYYTRVDRDSTGTLTVKVVTPYDSYDGKAVPEAFVPWLHVSNGTHFIQGYRVGGKPYAYLDGGVDWLPTLANVLKCQPEEIVTMVMDVTLDKIKAVAHVTGRGYAASS